MRYSLNFLPEIENDLFSAYKWYEDKDKGLGEELLRMFYAAAFEIERNPEACQKIFGNFRRKIIKRFPYCIYYKIIDDKLVVFGFFHTARNPKIIFKNIRKRN